MNQIHMTSKLSDCFAGCVVGSAVGDAFGRHVEHSGDPKGSDWPTQAQEYSTKCLDLLAKGELMELDWPGMGQITDDTQLSVALIRSLVSKGGEFNNVDFAERLLTLLRNGCILGIGKTTYTELKALNADPSRTRAAGVGSASNGSAMRAAPIGLLLHWAPVEYIAEVAVLQSMPTHGHPEAQAAAVAVAAGVALCVVQTRALQPHAFITHVASAARMVPGGGRVADVVANVSDWMTMTTKEAFSRLKPMDPRGGGGVSGDAAVSVAWAVWAFSAHMASFEETWSAAIGGGGDTDTTACMACAFSGAYLGLSAVPILWSNVLHDHLPAIAGMPDLAVDLPSLMSLSAHLEEAALKRSTTS